MLIRPFIFFLVFVQSLVMSSNPGNQVKLVQKEEDNDEKRKVEIENIYKQLTAEQKVDLMLNNPIEISGKPFLSQPFELNTSSSIIKSRIAFIQNEKAADLWAMEYLQKEGNLVSFEALAATSIKDRDFISDNPLNKAKKLDQYHKSFHSQGLHLYYTGIWSKLDDIKDQMEMESQVLSTLRQMKTQNCILAYDSLFEENSLLYKGSLQRSLQDFRANYQFKGMFIYQPEKTCSLDKMSLALLSGVDMLLGLNEEEKSEVKKKILDRVNKKPELAEDQVKRIIEIKLNAENRKKADVDIRNAQLEMQATESSMVCIKNDNNFLPIRNLNERFQFKGFNLEETDLLYNYVLPTENAQNILYKGSPDNFSEIIKKAANDGAKNKVLITDAITLYSNRTRNLSDFSQIVVFPKNDALNSSIAIQAVFGSFGMKGNLPFFLTPDFKANTSITTESIQRMRYLAPEYIGLDPAILLEADSIVEEAIDYGTFPGCQVLFAWNNTVVYQKSFGHISSSKKEKTNNRILYDIASISKIAGSTCALMSLDGKGKFSLNKKLNDYLPELMEGSNLKNIEIKDMMAHQAGLPAWIPFYSKTLSNNKLNPNFYSKDSSKTMGIPVAKDVYLLNSYPDSIYKRILAQNLGPKKYLYSDLGYYFVKKIVEKQGQMAFDAYLTNAIYKPLGLQNMQFNPYKTVSLNHIAPTEDDKLFRKQVIQGYVHDPGAAMLGGVGGHAGLFCNANDLAILMQMLLNGGTYGGNTILKKEVIDAYTGVQFPESNRRGAGFDKPTLSGKGGTACDEASPLSYGHSGFTGTLTWADPKYSINYVFLSNRVNPDAENWKIVKTNVRTRIQSVWYKAVKRAQLIDYTSYL